MDLLSEILQTVQLRGTVYFHARFGSPWGMQIPAGRFANFHIVSSGNCWLKTAEPAKYLQLFAGDIVLFPQGMAHSLLDRPDSPAVSADELLNNARSDADDGLVFGGDGRESACLICGHFVYDREFPHPLFETLPPMIHLSSRHSRRTDWYATASEMAARIGADPVLGTDAVIDRLAESVFIQILIEYMHSLEDPASFLAAAYDRKIGFALQAIHDDIGRDWSIEELANIACMSRSVFSDRFHKLVGEPPILYVAKWRMLKARELLAATRMPISRISEKVGYRSEYAFNRAFKKMTGQTPGSLRRKTESAGNSGN